jgi:hypothetical protein
MPCMGNNLEEIRKSPLREVGTLKSDLFYENQLDGILVKVGVIRVGVVIIITTLFLLMMTCHNLIRSFIAKYIWGLCSLNLSWRYNVDGTSEPIANAGSMFLMHTIAPLSFAHIELDRSCN